MSSLRDILRDFKSFHQKHLLFYFMIASARSKVKGHLQLYHAYIPDGNEATDPGSANGNGAVATAAGSATTAGSAASSSETLALSNQDPEPGWELVEAVSDGNGPTGSGTMANGGQAQVEQPARVIFPYLSQPEHIKQSGQELEEDYDLFAPPLREPYQLGKPGEVVVVVFFFLRRASQHVTV